MSRVHVLTLGCPKNQVDAEVMLGVLARAGHELVADPEQADVLVVNTCAFIGPAKEESIDAVLDAARAKAGRAGRKLVVSGCLAQRYADELRAGLPEVDAFVGTGDLTRIAEAVAAPGGSEPVVYRGAQHELPAHGVSPRIRTGAWWTAYLKVSEGCDRRCAYCTIPTIRGRFVSSPVEAIEAEAGELLAAGARELVLVGQDIAAYGRDLADGTDLAALVGRLDALDGDFRLRLMYVQPDGVTDRLLNAIANSTRVCAYLDIPLQHAAAPVLRAMGRSGSAQSHLELLARVRSVLPDITLRTTVMTGFPGESARDFAELEGFLAEAGFDYVGVFAYSPEEGTRAAALPGQVRSAIRASRAQRLRDAADALGAERAAERVGSVQRVLIEGTDEDGALWGRTCGQAPEVDGITLVDGTAVVGAFANLMIVDAVGYDLVGRVV